MSRSSHIKECVSSDFEVLGLKFPVYLLLARFRSSADLCGADTVMNGLILLTWLVGGEAFYQLFLAYYIFYILIGDGQTQGGLGSNTVGRTKRDSGFWSIKEQLYVSVRVVEIIGPQTCDFRATYEKSSCEDERKGIW